MGASIVVESGVGFSTDNLIYWFGRHPTSLRALQEKRRNEGDTVLNAKKKDGNRAAWLH